MNKLAKVGSFLIVLIFAAANNFYAKEMSRGFCKNSHIQFSACASPTLFATIDSTNDENIHEQNRQEFLSLAFLKAQGLQKTLSSDTVLQPQFNLRSISKFKSAVIGLESLF